MPALLSNSLPRSAGERPLTPLGSVRAAVPRVRARRAAGVRGSAASEREFRVYAIVRTGGRQQKVAVGDVIEVDRISESKVGDSVELSTLLVVDGEAVTSDPWVLNGVKVSAEVVDHH